MTWIDGNTINNAYSTTAARIIVNTRNMVAPSIVYPGIAPGLT